MAVKRIVANIAASDLARAKAFYGDLLGLDIVMDHGWIMTFASETTMTPQLSVATQGGSGTAVPDLSPSAGACEQSFAVIAASHNLSRSFGTLGASRR